MTRSLYFTRGENGSFKPATSMEQAVLEVLAVPDDYPDDSARQIAESVLMSGVIENRARAGIRGGPVHISWTALVEKGIAVGVLAHEDA